MINNIASCFHNLRKVSKNGADSRVIDSANQRASSKNHFRSRPYQYIQFVLDNMSGLRLIKKLFDEENEKYEEELKATDNEHLLVEKVKKSLF